MQQSNIGVVLGLLSFGAMSYFALSGKWKWFFILGAVNLGATLYVMSQGETVDV